MVGMFCSLKEAAERLQVSEGEIEALLKRGALREFREGPYRLVRTIDVGTLAQSLVGPVDDFPPAAGVPERDGWRLGSLDEREMRLPHCAAATLRAPAPSPARPRYTERTQPQRMSTRGVQRNSPAPSGRVHGRTSRPVRRTDAQTHEQSVRQWFWNGLLQDRPVTIVILFGLVLLVLSALIAGVCVFGPLVVGGHMP